jgi:hypothetical protein
MTSDHPQRLSWREDLEQRCQKNAEIARQREETEVVYFPL